MISKFHLPTSLRSPVFVAFVLFLLPLVAEAACFREDAGPYGYNDRTCANMPPPYFIGGFWLVFIISVLVSEYLMLRRVRIDDLVWIDLRKSWISINAAVIFCMSLLLGVWIFFVYSNEWIIEKMLAFDRRVYDLNERWLRPIGPTLVHLPLIMLSILSKHVFFRFLPSRIRLGFLFYSAAFAIAFSIVVTTLFPWRNLGNW
mgnify:CR=1 FL=1